MRDVLRDFDVEHKYSFEFEKRVRGLLVAFTDEMDFAADLDWTFEQMKMRLVVGQCRYGRVPMINPDQIATIGPKWDVGYDICDSKLDGFRSGLRNKWAAFNRTGNGDLLPDIANYAMLRFMFDDNADEWDMIIHGVEAVTFRYLRDHPNYHEEQLDQSIHGKERSGSARVINTSRV